MAGMIVGVLRWIDNSALVRRVRDVGQLYFNIVRYGPDAPRPNERVWVVPSDVTFTLDGVRVRSGRVISRWPFVAPLAFEEHPHVKFALAHWRDGIPWEETGAYSYMLEQIRRRGRQDGCHSIVDVERRYQRLDELFETVLHEGRLRTRSELDSTARGEDGGILIHIGPHGATAIGDSGKHRMTIAKLLRLSLVPARLGFVHRDALRLLPRFRDPPSA